MTHLVVGLGEVGGSLRSVLDCPGHDPWKGSSYFGAKVDFLHICFPYSLAFVENVVEAQSQYLAPGGYTIIHSSVPVGTTSQFASAVHSPVRGKHPHLAESLTTFDKWVAGPDAAPVVAALREVGIPAVWVGEDTRVSEAAKLWSTTRLGWDVVYEKAVHAYCEEHEIDFEKVYTLWTESYSRGYTDLGHPEYVRPVLSHSPGKIGGHCVIPNARLLDAALADMLLEFDETLEDE